MRRPFDFDLDEDEKYSLEYIYKDKDLNVSFKSDYLPNVLQNVCDFLRATGFTYVTKLSAHKDSGEVVSNEDDEFSEEEYVTKVEEDDTGERE